MNHNRELFTPSFDQCEAIERLCKLAGEVAESHGWTISADCLCGENRLNVGNFTNEAISRIEAIVREAIREGRA